MNARENFAKKSKKARRKQLNKEWYAWKKKTLFFMTVNSTPVPILHKITVALDLPRSVDKLIVRATEVVAAVTASTWITTPSPTMLVVTAAISNLTAKQNLAKQRTIGAVANRNTARTTLVDLLRSLKFYIQTLCIADPINAGAIALSALMYIKNQPIKQKSKMKVKQLISKSIELAGSIKGKPKSHDWGISTDPNDPNSWLVIPIPQTTKGKTEIDSLTPGVHYYFRHRCLLSSGYTDYEYADRIVL